MPSPLSTSNSPTSSARTSREEKEPSGDASQTDAVDRSKGVKCVVWDLDETLWRGVLAEDEDVKVRSEAVEAIRELDQRGILQSIASRNDHDQAMERLRDLDLVDYFLYPKINWGSKAHSIQQIAEDLNIGIDTLAFIDDQPFERDEVRHAHPDVRCLDASVVKDLLDRPAFTPRFVTQESARRREMYQSQRERTEKKASFEGPKEAFLKTLEMVFVIKRATEDDLKRAEELTVRTNQLNATGYTYSYDELNAFRQSDGYELLVTRLDDTYGTYGTIGLTLVETGSRAWRVKLLLMSCRVMSRGVGTVLLNFILRQAKAEGVSVEAEFVPTDRNRQMYVGYRFSGFEEAGQTDDGVVIMKHDGTQVQEVPDHVALRLEGCPLRAHAQT